MKTKRKTYLFGYDMPFGYSPKARQCTRRFRNDHEAQAFVSGLLLGGMQRVRFRAATAPNDRAKS